MRVIMPLSTEAVKKTGEPGGQKFLKNFTDAVA
jgi:hypothetical protein